MLSINFGIYYLAFAIICFVTTKLRKILRMEEKIEKKIRDNIG